MTKRQETSYDNRLKWPVALCSVTKAMASRFSAASIKHIAEAAMEPAFAARVVALAVDVLVEHVRVVPAEPPDFLLKTKPRVIHELDVAPVPERAMTLNRPVDPVAGSFDHV